MRVLSVTGIALLTLAAAAAIWSFREEAAAATRIVTVGDDFYQDADSGTSGTAISVGDTVQWNWSGSGQHTVTSTGGPQSFDSGAPQTSGMFSHTFAMAGDYTYICGVHGQAMTGTIVVGGPPSTSTPQAAASNTAAASASRTATQASGTTVPSATTAPGTTPVPATTTVAPPPAGSTAIAFTPTRTGGAAGAQLPAAGAGPGDGSPPFARLGAILLAVAGMAALVGAVAMRRRSAGGSL